jgi:GNAT superfamily N-acetyltransferase
LKLYPQIDCDARLEGLRAGEICLARGTQTTMEQRTAFFTRTHRRLAPSLAQNWHWWFRVGFHPEIEPIVALARNQIIGHAGTLPFAFRYGESINIAVWYLVFAVLPECQGQGLGKRMTEEWMKLSPNPITECNEKSIAIFKQYGWQETFTTRRFACVTDPVKLASRLPAPLRIVLPLARPFYRSWLKCCSRSAPALKPELVPANPRAIDMFQSEPAMPMEILRDEDWIRWRVLESPFLPGYRIFRFESAIAIVRGLVSDGVRRLHIMYVNRPREDEDRSRLIRGIVRWACEGRADLIWAVARDTDLATALRESLPMELGVRIGAYNSNPEMMTSFLNPGFQIQAIDSDIELSYAEDPGTAFCWD